MKISEYLKGPIEPLKQRTLVFLIDKINNRILLGHKKRGFGEGKLNGIGGKVEEGETVEQAAMREGFEEVGIEFGKLTRVALLDFYFPYVDNPAKWNQQVVVYLCNRWHGHPIETEEIKPEWFPLNKVPHDQMWSDDVFWFPKVLEGSMIRAKFLFGKDLLVEDSEIQEVENQNELF